MEFYLPNLCFFVSIKFNARNIIFNQRPIVINKISIDYNKDYKIPIKIMKTTIINTIYTLQELILFSFSFLVRVILANFTSSIVSVHSSINLSTNFFLHLQFS